jgi:hypothetical protein
MHPRADAAVGTMSASRTLRKYVFRLAALMLVAGFVLTRIGGPSHHLHWMDQDIMSTATAWGLLLVYGGGLVLFGLLAAVLAGSGRVVAADWHERPVGQNFVTSDARPTMEAESLEQLKMKEKWAKLRSKPEPRNVVVHDEPHIRT